jgi:hypothetical protein
MKLTRNLPAAQYHAIKALSASVAFTMVEQCPLKGWIASPWNPALVAENKSVFDIGTALHLAVLEPEEFEERVVCHEYEEYRSGDAKFIRDGAYAAGKTPLKPSEGDLVEELRKSIWAEREIAEKLERPGDAEISMEWEWEGVPCKARPDFLPSDYSFVLDLKTANTAQPEALGRKAMVEGWHVRAAWYLAGVQAVTGVTPQTYWFAVVEKDAPHIAQLYEMDPKALVRGEQIIMRALDQFAACQRSGFWPKYRSGPSVITLPGWAEFKYAEREEMGEL